MELDMMSRVHLCGGTAHWLNMNGAMKIGGFVDPEEIYQAIEGGEIKVKESLLFDNDPRSEHSWIQIATDSYLVWLEKRQRISIKEINNKYDNIHKAIIENRVKLGFLQHELNCLKINATNNEILLSENLRLLKLLTGFLVGGKVQQLADLKKGIKMGVA